LRKMPIFGLFRHFDPGSYRGFFRKNGQKWPFSPKLAKNGVFGHNTPFWGILGLFGPSGARWRRGFTSTPSGRGLPGAWEGLPDPSGDRGPGSRGPGSRRPPGSGSRGAPLPRGRPRGALRTPSGVPDTAAGVVLHQPLAAGPRGSRRGPGDPGSRRVPGDLPGRPFPSPGPGGASDPFFRPPREPRAVPTPARRRRP